MIKAIYNYIPNLANKNEGYARDIWLFGYFANGINPKDIACLKWKNIEDDIILIVREKTKFTTRTQPRQIVIPINDDMKAIIDRWGSSEKSPDNYIFPVLQAGLSAHRVYELIQAFTGLINDWMKVIAANLGINKKVSTITWRHTFATVMKRSGASTEYIQEAFGHTNVKTTESYLDSFEIDAKRKHAEFLTAFKDILE